VITEFALSATYTLQAAQIVKNDRDNPQAPRRRRRGGVAPAADKIHRLL